jgi:hypothetical protein
MQCPIRRRKLDTRAETRRRVQWVRLVGGSGPARGWRPAAPWCAPKATLGTALSGERAATDRFLSVRSGWRMRGATLDAALDGLPLDDAVYLVLAADNPFAWGAFYAMSPLVWPRPFGLVACTPGGNASQVATRMPALPPGSTVSVVLVELAAVVARLAAGGHRAGHRGRAAGRPPAATVHRAGGGCMDVILFALAIAVAGWGGLGVTLLLADRATDRHTDQPTQQQSLGVGGGAVPVVPVRHCARVVRVVLRGCRRRCHHPAGGHRRVSRGGGCRRLGAARRSAATCGCAAAACSPQPDRPPACSSLTLLMTLTVWRFARRLVLGWDGLHIWEFKARLAFDNGGTVPAAYFRDVSRMWSHVDYPQYLPLTETWVYGWLRADRTKQPWWRAVPAVLPRGLWAAVGRRAHAGYQPHAWRRRWPWWH